MTFNIRAQGIPQHPRPPEPVTEPPPVKVRQGPKGEKVMEKNNAAQA